MTPDSNEADRGNSPDSKRRKLAGDASPAAVPLPKHPLSGTTEKASSSTAPPPFEFVAAAADPISLSAAVGNDDGSDPYAELGHLVDDDDAAELPHISNKELWEPIATGDGNPDSGDSGMFGYPKGAGTGHKWVYQAEEDLYFRVSESAFYVAAGGSEGASKGVVPRTEEAMEELPRMVGVCVKWNASKGFGFLQVDELDKQIFVHNKQLRTTNAAFKRLHENDRVTFTLDQQNERLCAADVQFAQIETEPEMPDQANLLDPESLPDANLQEPAAKRKKTKSKSASQVEGAAPEDGEEEEEVASESGSHDEININKSLVCQYYSQKGPMKSENQDRYAEKKTLPNMHSDEAEFFYLGLFDGHNGDGCAEYAKNHLDKNLCAAFNQIMAKKHHNADGEVADPPLEHFVKAMKAGFKTTDKNWLHLAKRETELSGSTAVCCVFYGPDDDGELSLYTAHAGDSFALLCRNDEALRITSDHKPSRPDELKRINSLPDGIAQPCSGVWRVLVKGPQQPNPGGGPAAVNYMGLAVSRSLGDLPFKETGVQYISGVPEVKKTTVDRLNDRFLLLASDGISDVLSDDALVEFVLAQLEVEENEGRPIVEMSGNTNVASSGGAAAAAAIVTDMTKQTTTNIAQKVVAKARALGSNDDCTCAICFFDWKGEEEEEDVRSDAQEEAAVAEGAADVAEGNSKVAIAGDREEATNGVEGEAGPVAGVEGVEGEHKTANSSCADAQKTAGSEDVDMADADAEARSSEEHEFHSAVENDETEKSRRKSTAAKQEDGGASAEAACEGAAPESTEAETAAGPEAKQDAC